MTPKRGSRLPIGFTLIELLVVIAIMGVLIALLLPAIQQARLAAAEAQNRNNLKQLGLGLQNYHDQEGVFPAAYLIQFGGGGIHGVPDSITGDAGPGWAWGAMVLPFIDNQSTHEQFNFALPCWFADNSTAARRPVGTFLSPVMTASADSFTVIDFSSAPLATFARSSYAANAGTQEPWGYFFPGDVAQFADGPMYRNSRVKIRDVIDGLSKTVFLGEHHAGLSDKTWVGVVPGAAVCPSPRFAFSAEGCDTAATLVNVHSGPAPLDNPPIIHAPCSPVAHVCSMWSENPDGCNVLLGDGSVFFVTTSIDPLTWAAMCTYRGGEQMGNF